MSGRSLIAIALAVLSLGGCSLPGAVQPPAATPAATQPTKLQQAQATHEYPSPPPPPDRVAKSAQAAAQAVRAFADEYINWDAANVTARMQELATNSIGQARSAMALAAAQTANDYELRRGGIANVGTVEAVAPLPSGKNEYVVVTREQTTATNTTAYQGLQPAWHVAIATTAQVAPGQWVVSRWQPES